MDYRAVLVAAVVVALLALAHWFYRRKTGPITAVLTGFDEPGEAPTGCNGNYKWSGLKTGWKGSEVGWGGAESSPLFVADTDNLAAGQDKAMVIQPWESGVRCFYTKSGANVVAGDRELPGDVKFTVSDPGRLKSLLAKAPATAGWPPV